MRSSSSQADSAGSIPVTRSTREMRCHTYDRALFSIWIGAARRQKSALVPLRVPLAILASDPGDCQFPSFLVIIRAHVVSGPLVAIFGPVECHLGPTLTGIVRLSGFTLMPRFAHDDVPACPDISRDDRRRCSSCGPVLTSSRRYLEPSSSAPSE